MWTKTKFPTIEDIEKVIFEERDHSTILKMKTFFEKNFKELDSNCLMNFGYFLICTKEEERGLKIMRNSLEDRDDTLVEESKDLLKNILRESEFLRTELPIRSNKKIQFTTGTTFQSVFDQFKTKCFMWKCCMFYLESLDSVTWHMSPIGLRSLHEKMVKFMNYIRSVMSEHFSLDTLEFLVVEASLLEKCMDYLPLKAKYDRILELLKECPEEERSSYVQQMYEKKQNFYRRFNKRFEWLFPKKRIDESTHFQNVEQYLRRIESSGMIMTEISEKGTDNHWGTCDFYPSNALVKLRNDDFLIFDKYSGTWNSLFLVPKTFRVFAEDIGGYLMTVNPFFNSDYLLFFDGSFVRTLNSSTERLLCMHGYLVLERDNLDILEVIYNGEKAGQLNIGHLEDRENISVLCKDFLVYGEEIKFWKQYGFSGTFLGFSSLDFSKPPELHPDTSFDHIDDQGFRRNEGSGKVEVLYESPYTWTRIPEIFRLMNDLSPIREFSQCLSNMATKGVFSFNPIRHGKKLKFRDFCEPYQNFILHLLLVFEKTESEFSVLPKEIVLHEILPFISEIGVFVTHHWVVKRYLEINSYKILACSPPFEEKYFHHIKEIHDAEDETSPWDILSSFAAFAQWLNCDDKSSIKKMLELLEISFSNKEIRFGATLPKLMTYLFRENELTNFIFGELRVRMFTFLNLIVEYMNTSLISLISKSHNVLEKPENCSFSISPFLGILTYILVSYNDIAENPILYHDHLTHIHDFFEEEGSLKYFLKFIVASVRSKVPDSGFPAIGFDSVTGMNNSTRLGNLSGLSSLVTFELPRHSQAPTVDIRLIDLLSKLSASESLMERIDSTSAVNILSSFEAFFQANIQPWKSFDFCASGDEEHEATRRRCRRIFEFLHTWFHRYSRNSIIIRAIYNLLLNQFSKFNSSLFDFMCDCLFSKTPSPFFPVDIEKFSRDSYGLLFDYLAWTTNVFSEYRFLLSSIPYFKTLKIAFLSERNISVPPESIDSFFKRLDLLDRKNFLFRVMFGGENDFDEFVSYIYRRQIVHTRGLCDLVNVRHLKDFDIILSTILRIVERLPEVSDSSLTNVSTFTYGVVAILLVGFSFENLKLKSEVVVTCERIMMNLKEIRMLTPFSVGNTPSSIIQEVRRKHDLIPRGNFGLFFDMSRLVIDVRSNCQKYLKEIETGDYVSVEEEVGEITKKIIKDNEGKDLPKKEVIELAKKELRNTRNARIRRYGKMMFLADYIFESKKSSLSEVFEKSIKKFSLDIVIFSGGPSLFLRIRTSFLKKYKDFLVFDTSTIGKFKRVIVHNVKKAISRGNFGGLKTKLYLALSYFPIESREFTSSLMLLVEQGLLEKKKDAPDLNNPDVESMFKKLFWNIFTKLKEEDKSFIVKEIIRYSISSWLLAEKCSNRSFLAIHVLGRVLSLDFFVDNLSVEECSDVLKAILSFVAEVEVPCEEWKILDVMKIVKRLLFHPKYSTFLMKKFLSEGFIKKICSFGLEGQYFDLLIQENLDEEGERRKKDCQRSFLFTAGLLLELFRDHPCSRNFIISRVMTDNFHESILVGFQRVKDFGFTGDNYVAEYRKRVLVVNKETSSRTEKYAESVECNSVEFLNICQEFLILVMEHLEKERGSTYLENNLIHTGVFINLVTCGEGLNMEFRSVNDFESNERKKLAVAEHLKRGLLLRVLSRVGCDIPQYILEDPRVRIKKEEEEEEEEEGEEDDDDEESKIRKKKKKGIPRGYFFDFENAMSKPFEADGVQKFERRRTKRRNPRLQTSSQQPSRNNDQAPMKGVNWKFDNSDLEFKKKNVEKINFIRDKESSFPYSGTGSPFIEFSFNEEGGFSLLNEEEPKPEKSSPENSVTGGFSFDEGSEEDKDNKENFTGGFEDLDFKFDETGATATTSFTQDADFQPEPSSTSKDDQVFNLDLSFSETKNGEKDDDMDEDEEEKDGKGESSGDGIDFKTNEKGDKKDDVFFF